MDLVDKYLGEGIGKQGTNLDSTELLHKETKLSKSISLHTYKEGNEFQVIIDTESLAPNSVRGVKSSLIRKKFTDEKKAWTSYDKSISTAKKKGWEETYKSTEVRKGRKGKW